MKFRFLFILLFFIIQFHLVSADIYKITIMGTFSGETISLPNGGNFNVFKGNAAFSDSDGNYGDATGRGIRETNKDKKLTNVYAILIFESEDGSKMMARPKRVQSRIDAGAGKFEILSANGKFKKYQGYNCNYAISTTKNGSFIQECICKKD